MTLVIFLAFCLHTRYVNTYLTDFLMLTEDEKKGLKTPLCRTPVSELLQFAAQFLPTGKHCYPSIELPSHISDLINYLPAQDKLQPGQPLYTFDNVPAKSRLNTSSSMSSPVVDRCDKLQPSHPSYTDDSESLGSIVQSNSHSITAVSKSSTVSDSVTSDSCEKFSSFTYPPMPAAAQHISVVQARILRSSSSVTDMPVSENSDVISATVEIESPCLLEQVVNDCGAECNDGDRPTSTVADSDGTCSTRSRLTTPRRSRVVARFGLISNDD